MDTGELLLQEPGGDPYAGLQETARQVRERIYWYSMSPSIAKALRPIQGAQQGVFDVIAAGLRDIIDRITPSTMFSWLNSLVFEPLKSWLSLRVFTPLLGTLWTLQGSLTGWWQGALDGLKAALSNLLGMISRTLTGAAQLVGAIVQAAIEGVKGAVRGGLDLLRAVVGLIPEEIRKSIRELWEKITQKLEAGLATLAYVSLTGSIGLHNLIGAWFYKNVIDQEGRTKLLDRFLNSWPGQLTVSVAKAVQEALELVLEAIREVWGALSPIVIEKARQVISAVRPHVQSWIEGFESIPATFLEWAAATAGTDLALQPSRALHTAGTLYSMSLAAGSAAMLTSTALNAIPTTNWVGMSQLSAFIAQAAGFEPLTRATYGVLIDECLTWPLRYHWNQALRPKMPAEGEIFVMGRKRGLNKGEFYDAMAKAGIPDQWIERMYRFFWTDPSPMWLLRMSEVSKPDIEPSELFLPWLEEWIPNWRTDPWAWYRMKILLAGFEDTDVPAFIQAFQRRLVATSVTQYKTSVRALIRAGFWSRENVLEALAPVGTRQEEIDLMIAAEEMDYLKDYLQGQVTYYQETYRKGQISAQDLELALSTLIVRPERVVQLVSLEKVKALAKPKAISPPKEDPLVTKLKNQAVDSWIKRFRSWGISSEDLKLGLSIVLEDIDRAVALVDVELTRYREPPEEPAPEPEDPVVAQTRRSSIASWVDLFRKGEITADGLELRLSPLIADHESIVQIRQLEELRARPAPEIIPQPEEDTDTAEIRKTKIQGHLEAFRKRSIGLNLLQVYLVADGLSVDLARATVVTEASKRIKVPSLDSPYYLQDKILPLYEQGMEAYLDALLRGEISLDQYVAWLSSMGIDADLVTYLADTAALKAFLKGFPV